MILKLSIISIDIGNEERNYYPLSLLSFKRNTRVSDCDGQLTEIA
jgi:hypothetical protein